eukprot:scaffold29356_cov47-Attheya_sp.AAC.1
MSDNFLLHHWNLEGCWRKGQSTTILDRATWELLQDAYRRAVPPGKSTIALEPTTGMTVPYEVRKFTDELSWRRFVSSIPYELACDVHEWSYVKQDEHGEKALHIDLDDAAFTNIPSDDQEVNTESAREPDPFSISTRDINIKAGEEITMSYAGLTDNIDWYKLMKRVAWVEGYYEGYYEASSSSADDDDEGYYYEYEASSSSADDEGYYEASSSSADEEVEPETPTEDNDSTKKETVPDNVEHKRIGQHKMPPKGMSNMSDIVAWLEGYETSSSSAHEKRESAEEISDSTEEEVEPEKNTEDNDDSTKEETVTDNGPYKSGGLINTTGLRTNTINANPGLTLNGRGGPADHDQEHGWSKLPFFVFSLIIIWFFWKSSRYRHVFHFMRRRQKGHRVSKMKSLNLLK